MSNKIYQDGDDEFSAVAKGIFTFLFGAVFVTIVVFLSSIYGVFASGYVGMKLWAWFIVPVFGLKALTFYQAWGLALITGFFTHQYHSSNSDKDTTAGEQFKQIFIMLLYPWLVLLIGWIGKTLFF